MQAKKYPVRMCTGCGVQKQKRDLIRVVKSPDGEISIDYLCNDLECLKKARKARRLERALSCQIPQEVYDRLEKELAGHA